MVDGDQMADWSKEYRRQRDRADKFRAALQEIADCDRRNGMVLGGYEALHIARAALAADL